MTGLASEFDSMWSAFAGLLFELAKEGAGFPVLPDRQ
jgi:hypothetical protein